MSFCPHCGTRVSNPANKFCSECGKSLEQSAFTRVQEIPLAPPVRLRFAASAPLLVILAMCFYVVTCIGVLNFAVPEGVKKYDMHMNEVALEMGVVYESNARIPFREDYARQFKTFALWQLASLLAFNITSLSVSFGRFKRRRGITIEKMHRTATVTSIVIGIVLFLIPFVFNFWDSLSAMESIIGSSPSFVVIILSAASAMTCATLAFYETPSEKPSRDQS